MAMKQNNSGTKSIAVIGAGISGITAAHYLQDRYNVTLFEKHSTLGGHTRTINVQEGNREIPIDIGFIVLNNKNYPNFTKFLNELAVPVAWSDMSFGYYNRETKFCYAGTSLNGLFADRKNLFRRSFWSFLSDLKRFSATALVDLANGALTGKTLKEYLLHLKLNHDTVHNYLYPMAEAIWSGGERSIEDFPAVLFVEFFKNHGLLSLKDRPRWQTVVGGSSSYVKAFENHFKGRIIKAEEVLKIKRKGWIQVVETTNSRLEFDIIIIATHADQALALLEEPTAEESLALGSWRYSNNQVVLHFDEAVMPPQKRSWASWNVIDSATTDHETVAVTYWMNKLQNIKSEKNYFVTLNPSGSIDPKKIIYQTNFTHPQYSFAALQSQQQLKNLNGKNSTYFCGSYCGYGFHEDGVVSALRIVNEL
jgi:predicted NAD/FAD-binding protein